MDSGIMRKILDIFSSETLLRKVYNRLAATGTILFLKAHSADMLSA
jgi:hypothetical protein